MRGFWIAVVLGLAPRAASADLSDLKLEGTYGKLGAQTGYAFSRERGSSPHVGVVGTFVHINEFLEWYGVQADLTVDGNGDHKAGGRWSFGPEAGVAVYGVDISYFGQRIDTGVQHGMQIRTKLTVGVAAVYLRASHAMINGDETSFDIGLQLKKPVFVRRKKLPRVVALR
jgi:hypothetical protein